MGAAQRASAKAEKTFIVDLPVLNLEHSLSQLARQTRISIDFSHLELKNKKRRAVLGLYSIEEALDAVLAGSGYGWQKAGPGAYRLVLAPKRPKKIKKRLGTAGNAIKSLFRKPPPGDTIIIHATKRSAIARRLPMSLSVMPGARLETLQITDTNALALHTAGMSSTNLGPSRNKIFIRGISDGSFTGRQQATIGAYLDNVRLNYNEPDPFLQLEDVDHVEVLRGPQGTLYGAGSLGGLYRVVSNAPDLQNASASFNAGGSVTRSGGANTRLSATVNLPLARDTLALRVTGYLDHNNGYIDDVRLGLKNVNTSDVFGARARFLLNVRENWQINAGFNFQDVITDDTQYFLESLGPYKRANYLREPHEDDFLNPYGDVRGSFGWGNIVSSTSFVHRLIGDIIDASTGVPALAALPVAPSPFEIDRTINMVTNETRLVSRPGRTFDWLVGAFASLRHENFLSDLTIPGSAALLQGGARNGDVAFKENRRERTREAALFGEATWHLPWRFALTGGLRWSHTSERSRSTIDGSLGTGPVMRFGRNRTTDITSKAVLSYQASDHTLLYAQFSQGFRPGGINPNNPVNVFTESESNEGTEDAGEPSDQENTSSDQTFGKDELSMYEIGGKFSLPRHKLQVDVAAFAFQWHDIQSDQLLPSGFSFILNAGSARSRGLDVNAHFAPMEHLTFDANLSFTDSDLTIASPLLGGSPNSHLPSIPKFTGGLSALYSWPAWGGKNWAFGADYTFTGRSNLTFSSADNRRSDVSNRVNLRLALDAPERWEITVYVRNVLNDKENTFAFGNPFSFRQSVHTTPPLPRTAGFTLSKHF